MRLPTSTIVMAAVTCGLFGLAIRETVSGKDKPADAQHDWRYDSITADSLAAENAAFDEQEIARAEVLRADLEKRTEAESEQHAQARAELYGAEPATLGHAFAGIALGMSADSIPSTSSPAIQALEKAADVDIELVTTHGLDAISIRPTETATSDDSGELCESLTEKLEEAWGSGIVHGLRRIWTNPVTRTRAWIHPDHCELQFEAFATAKQWIDKAPASLVPVWAVGQPANKLREKLGERAIADDDFEVASQLSWTELGLGTGTGRTSLIAWIHKKTDKVVALSVNVQVTDGTLSQLVTQISALYGASSDGEDGYLRWKGRPPISIENFDGLLTIVIGTLPSVQ